MTDRVLGRLSGDERARRDDSAGELGVVALDPGVDDRHPHRGQIGRGGLPEGECADGREVPLERRERVGRHERQPARSLDRLRVLDPRDRPERGQRRLDVGNGEDDCAQRLERPIRDTTGHPLGLGRDDLDRRALE